MSLHMHDEQSIVAQCSPKGSGAIGLIRITGINAIQIADSIAQLADTKQLSNHSTHTIHYGKVVDNKGVVIDTVLFLLMHGPKTFTGQDTVEITCHNNPFIIESIIAQAISAGARLAQAGEFTKRAVINKKIDLIQAEAINDLIHANSQEGLKRSLSQLKGTLSHHIHNIEQQLIKALALSEASFEFIDEESLEFGDQIKEIVTSTLSAISKLRKTFSQQKQIREGVRIALIGSVNAGKSSLFNSIIGSSRAIVTNQAGTTRDVIEAGLYEKSLYWTLIDTAGLRQTNDVIEAAGIERSHNEAHKADIILLVVDGSRHLTAQEIIVYNDLLNKYKTKSLIVYTKSDLSQHAQILGDGRISISCTLPNSVKSLKKELLAKVDHLLKIEESPHLLTHRQHNLLLGLEQKLGLIMPHFEKDLAYELISHHLQEALSGIGEITGKTISERGMDAVFRDFCVGK